MLCRFFYNAKVYRQIKEIIKAKQINLVHVHNVFPLITPRIYRFLKKNGVYIVQTIHNYRFVCPNGILYCKNQICMRCIERKDFWPCVYFKCFRKSWALSALYAFFIAKYQKDFRHYIDRYIVLNEFAKNLLVDNRFEENKIVIKPNGLEGEAVKTASSGEYYLYLGRLSHEKGIKFLADYFVTTSNRKLVIAGVGPEFDILKEMSKEHAQIEMIGFVKGEAKNNLLINAKALIIPSLWHENYPVIIAEAFKHGVPVIASDKGGLPYIIQSGETGFIFKAGDSASLQNALQEFEKKNYELLQRNCREFYSVNMEETANCKRLVEIYEELLKTR